MGRIELPRNVRQGEAIEHSDVASQPDCDALVARAVHDFGGVDILATALAGVGGAGFSRLADV